MSVMRTAISTQSAANDLGNALTAWLERCNVTDLYRTCATCRNMETNGSRCLKFDRVPPATVIVVGCDSYVDFEDVPF